MRKVLGRHRAARGAAQRLLVAGPIVGAMLGALALAAPAQAASGFLAGAASVDVTPPPYT